MAGIRAEEGLPDAPQDILDTPQAAQAVVRGGAWRVISFVSSTLLGVLSASILVRYLGVEDLARYTTVVSLMAVVGGLFEAGLSTVGVRESSVLHGEERRRFLRDLLGLRIAVALLGVVVGVVVATIAGYSEAMVAGVALAGLGVLVYTIQTSYSIALQTTLRLGAFSALEFLRQVGFTVFAVLFVVLDLGLVALIAVSVPAHTLVLLFTIPLVVGITPFGMSFSARRWRDMLTRSIPVAAAAGLGVVYAYVAVLAMSAVTTDTETGFFSASFRIYLVLSTIPGLLVYSVLPILSRAARDDRERLDAGVKRTFEVAIFIGSGLALVSAVGAPVAIAIVAGSEFDASIDVLRIQGTTLLLTSASALGSIALLSVGDYRALMACVTTGLVTTLVLTVLLAPELGAIGTGLAHLAGEAVVASAYLVALWRRHGLAMRFPIAVRALMPALAGAAVAVLLPLPALAATFAAAATFVLAALLLGVMPRELLDVLPRRAR